MSRNRDIPWGCGERLWDNGMMVGFGNGIGMGMILGIDHFPSIFAFFIWVVGDFSTHVMKRHQQHHNLISQTVLILHNDRLDGLAYGVKGSYMDPKEIRGDIWTKAIKLDQIELPFLSNSVSKCTQSTRKCFNFGKFIKVIAKLGIGDGLRRG